MRKLNILAVSLSAAFILAGCDGEESTTENIAVEVPFALNDIPMPNDGYGYDDDGSISLPDEPSSPQSYSTNEEYEAYYQSFETSYAAVDGWGLCVEPIEIPLDSVNSGQVPAIDQSSLDGNVLLIDSQTNNVFDGGLKLSSDGRKLVVECGSALQPSTTYHLIVTSGVKTTEGISLQASTAFTELLDANPEDIDEKQTNLQQLTKDAISAYQELGGANGIAYAATFKTQSSYAGIDNIVQQTLENKPSLDLENLTVEIKGTVKKYAVVTGATLTTNNYLPFTQDIANRESCVLNSYDPIAGCPSMFKWMAGENGEHLTQNFFENGGKIDVHEDPTTLIPVDFYLPDLFTDKNEKLHSAIAKQYIENTANPTVLFIHGITGDRGSASLVAKDYVTGIGKKYVFAAIDMPYHGDRIICDTSGYSDDTTITYCPGPAFGKPISARADKSYFINITSPLALRSNIHQSVSDFIGLRSALNFGELSGREAHLVGVSLGGIMSVMTTEATYDQDSNPIRKLQFETANYAVPGQGLVNLTLSSLTLGSEMEESVKKSADVQRAIAETLIPNLCTVETSNEECITQLNNHSDQLSDSIEMLEDEIYDALIPVLKHGVQQTIDGADPAGKVARQREAKQPTLLIEAVGDCGTECEVGEYMPDTVVPNNADNNIMTGTDPLISALGLDPILETTSNASGIRGVIKATVGGHGTFLFPYEGPMDESGLPSTENLGDVESSRKTQQEAVLDMVKSKGTDIVLNESDDYINIVDEHEVEKDN
ncbi:MULTISPECIES: lipase [Vibrio]|uniref:lipase n=1 Tax=Vibrio TaxID=662 RepID=UPI0001B95200|nr:MULTISPECIES: lipase [Vibrio]EEX33713.1 lipase-like protein [Vibrio coralliilyticus ATCC BAA-450]